MAGFSLVQYLREIAALRGFELASDIVGWRASIATTGVVTYSTPPAPGERRTLTKKNYDYFFHKMIVGGTIDGTDVDDYDQIRFNLQRDGASENLFQNDVEVSGLFAAQSGEPAVVDFSPGGIKLPGGVDVDLTVTARAGPTVARVLTVKLVAALVPKDFHLHGRV